MKKKRFICVCEGGVSVARNNERAAKMGIHAAGHYNTAGGFCCPHHGNTCGRHPEYDTMQEWEREMDILESF